MTLIFTGPATCTSFWMRAVISFDSAMTSLSFTAPASTRTRTSLPERMA